MAANALRVAVLDCREYMGGAVTGGAPMLDGVQVKVVVVAIFNARCKTGGGDQWWWQQCWNTGCNRRR